MGASHSASMAATTAKEMKTLKTWKRVKPGATRASPHLTSNQKPKMPTISSRRTSAPVTISDPSRTTNMGCVGAMNTIANGAAVVLPSADAPNAHDEGKSAADTLTGSSTCQMHTRSSKWLLLHAAAAASPHRSSTHSPLNRSHLQPSPPALQTPPSWLHPLAMPRQTTQS